MNTQTIESRLVDLQQQLNHRIDAIKNDFAKGRSADFAEQITEKENDDVLMQLKDEAEAELLAVNKAIIKLRQGHYGNCEKCAEPIAQARLDTLPYTELCINCAK